MHYADVGESGKKALVKESSTYITDTEAEKMCKLFADGLEAGVGYDRIFDFMIRQRLDKKMVSKLRSSVIQYGDQLGEAFTRLGLLDAVSRKMLLVAEEQGELVPTFREQGKTFGDRDRRRKKFAYALAPSIVLIGFTTILFQIIVVMANGLADGSAWDVIKPALVTGGLQAGSIIGIQLVMIWGWLQVPVDMSIRDLGTRFLLNVPLISKPIRYRSMANFTRYLRQSLRAGMDMSRSIELAAEASNNPRLSKYIDASIEALEAGYSLEQCLSVMKGLDPEILDYIAIGEETGKLEENLRYLTKKFDQLADDNFDRVVSFLTAFLRYVIIIIVFIFALFKGLVNMFSNWATTFL